jgi:hypothetical protein
MCTKATLHQLTQIDRRPSSPSRILEAFASYTSCAATGKPTSQATSTITRNKASNHSGLASATHTYHVGEGKGPSPHKSACSTAPENSSSADLQHSGTYATLSAAPLHPPERERWNTSSQKPTPSTSTTASNTIDWATEASSKAESKTP